jgi:ethanolamine utilization protein EutP (predicted NTPase)
MFPDGIFWAAQDQDVRLILSTWIKKITGEETTPTINLQELIDTWNTIIRNKQVLIVVDDIESARIDFEVLLPKPLNCAVLLISRSAADIYESDVQVVVAPLTQAAGIELIRKHLVEAGRENVLTFNVLTQLAIAAEGHPLVLSRVVPMLDTMSVEQIVNEFNGADGGASNILDSIRRWIDGETTRWPRRTRRRGRAASRRSSS